MHENTTMVFDNRAGQSAKLAVLIPVRDDKRIHNLLASLRPQINDQVHVIVINDKQPESFIKELPVPIHGAILHHREPCKLSEKINMLWDFAQAEWLAVLESDAILHRDWVRDVFHIMEQGDEKSVHLGGELFEKTLNLNNSIFKKDDDYFPRHADQTCYANDTAWFMECEHRGIPLVKHRFEAIVFHDTILNTQPYRIGRLFRHMQDFGYLAAAYPKAGMIKRRILAEGYWLFRGICCTPVFLFFAVYYKIKNWLIRTTSSSSS